MALPKIIVTGSNGQLGRELKDLAAVYPQFEFHFFSREEFPINDEIIARELIHELQPSFFINCAAYTAVDKAEAENDLAMEINGIAPGALASLCRENSCKFIHISTDYVFNGESSSPLREDDPVAPVNFYGETKLKGEQLVQQHNPEAIIIRTAWVYSSYGKNFVKTMIRLMSEKESIGVVNDQVGSPTYAADLAAAILTIIASGKWRPGIYHYSNEGVISWFDFAKTIKELIQSACIVNPISTEQFPTPAKRPRYSVLDKSRISTIYGLQISDWKESLKACLKKMASYL
jgi:dTDP-4-dehydrorhamnose reductase